MRSDEQQASFDKLELRAQHECIFIAGRFAMTALLIIFFPAVLTMSTMKGLIDGFWGGLIWWVHSIRVCWKPVALNGKDGGI